ncbi:hypothetical protein T06_5070, partial [Trichinella sp. T6]
LYSASVKSPSGGFVTVSYNMIHHMKHAQLLSFEILLVGLGQHLKEPVAVPEKPSIFCICIVSVSSNGIFLKKPKLILL